MTEKDKTTDAEEEMFNRRTGDRRAPSAPRGEEREIITTHVYPPIPYRSNDWCAYFSDEGEEAGNYGWGETEEAAIHDLRQRYDPTYSEPCGDCVQINGKWCCTMNCYPRGRNLGVAYGL